jgi:hypothetical protein
MKRTKIFNIHDEARFLSPPLPSSGLPSFLFLSLLHLTPLTGEDAEVSEIQLPRLNLSFILKYVNEEEEEIDQGSGTLEGKEEGSRSLLESAREKKVRFYSREHDGFFISEEQQTDNNIWTNSLPFVLVLENKYKQQSLLVPAYILNPLDVAACVFPSFLSSSSPEPVIKNLNT